MQVFKTISSKCLNYESNNDKSTIYNLCKIAQNSGDLNQIQILYEVLTQTEKFITNYNDYDIFRFMFAYKLDLKSNYNLNDARLVSLILDPENQDLIYQEALIIFKNWLLQYPVFPFLAQIYKNRNNFTKIDFPAKLKHVESTLTLCFQILPRASWSHFILSIPESNFLSFVKLRHKALCQIVPDLSLILSKLSESRISIFLKYLFHPRLIQNYDAKLYNFDNESLALIFKKYKPNIFDQNTNLSKNIKTDIELLEPFQINQLIKQKHYKFALLKHSHSLSDKQKTIIYENINAQELFDYYLVKGDFEGIYLNLKKLYANDHELLSVLINFVQNSSLESPFRKIPDKIILDILSETVTNLEMVKVLNGCAREIAENDLILDILQKWPELGLVKVNKLKRLFRVIDTEIERSELIQTIFEVHPL